MLKKLLLICLLFFAFNKANATHIVGGELNYTFISANSDGTNTYEIQLKIYRDCFNGVPPFDDPAYLTIYNGDGSLYGNYSLTAPDSVNIPGTINNACFTPPNNVCVRKAVYKFTINLPVSAMGYYIAHQRCCRNNSIINIISPGETGSTYTAFIPGNSTVQKNSNPVFKQLPPIYICSGIPLKFDHSATDSDGDQIVYELCDPIQGASQFDPKPLQADAPPYDAVLWESGYNGGFPMNATPALFIDAQSGLLTGTPLQIGQWVVGVCAKEYRNGVLLSTTRRDFQFNVVNCPGLVVSAFPTQQLFCDGFTVNFLNNSVNATSYLWDFGVTNITSDVSTQATPSYTYPAAGTYRVTLIANPGSACADTSFSNCIVQPLLKVDFVTLPLVCLKNNSNNFSAGSVFGASAVFSWSFQGASPATSANQNPTGIKYNTPGTFPITLSISENGCTKSVTKQITMLPNINAGIEPQTDFCNGNTITFTNNSINTGAFYWDFGDPLSTADIDVTKDPTYTYTDTGTYTVMLIAGPGEQCADTAYTTVKIMPLLTVAIDPEAAQCLTNNSFNFNAEGTFTSNAVLNWNFTANANPASSSVKSPQNISFFNPDTHIVTLTVMEYGCVKTDTDLVVVLPDAKAIIQAQQEFCIGYRVDFTNLSLSSTSWFWNFGDPATLQDTSTSFNTFYNYPDSGVYIITLKVSNEACSDSTTSVFGVYPLLQPEIFPSDSGMCFKGNKFDFKGGGTYSAASIFLWNFPASASLDTSSLHDVYGVMFDTLGSQPVILTFFENGCVKKDTFNVYIYKHPKAFFDSIPWEGCVPLTTNFIDSSYAETELYYHWDFGDGSTSTEPDPNHIYTNSGFYDISLMVYTKAGCVDTSYFTWPSLVAARGWPSAGFTPDPAEASVFYPVIKFNDKSAGAVSCFYTFGDGFTSIDFSPVHTFADTGIYEVVQIVFNEFNCSDTIRGKVRVAPEYRIFIPNTFTPEGNGTNDVFKPVMIGVEVFNMKIFNRWGQLIFESDNTEYGWDGTIKGTYAQQDTYIYRITVTSVFHNEETFTGHVNLLR